MSDFNAYKPTISPPDPDYPTKWNGAMDDLDDIFNTAALFAGTVTAVGLTTVDEIRGTKGGFGSYTVADTPLFAYLDHATDPAFLVRQDGAANIQAWQSAGGAELAYMSQTGFTVNGPITSTTKIYINDTVNANLTVGLTINQGAADDQILAFKSSDVAHGITGVVETDTYGDVSKSSATEGGLLFRGFTEGTCGMQLLAAHTTDDTLKTDAASGAFKFDARLKSGTGLAGLGANGNIAVFSTIGATRFIMDAEGSFHADVESITFDDYDDVALIEAMDMEAQRRRGDPIKAEYADWLKENRAILQREGIVNYYDKDGKRVMVNLTRQAMLFGGAIRQIARKLKAVETRLALT